MSIRTGWSGNIRASATFVANNTYYACTNTVACQAGADTIRLVIAAADASAGNVTIKAEISNGAASPTYSQIGGDLGPIAVGSGETKVFVLPVKFAGGDVVKISFKCSAGEGSAKVAIDALAYISGKGIDDADTSQIYSSSADGSLTMTTDYPPNIIVTGSASNYTVSLPDATTLDLGAKYVITNASSEFILVKNSGTASSVWEFVGPKSKLTAILSAAASAAGTWSITVDIPRGDMYYDNDFLFSIANGNPPTNIRCTIGTSSGYYVTGEAYTQSSGGDLVMNLRTDAGLAGYVNAFILGPALTGATILNKGYPCRYYQKATVSALSDGTDTYSTRFGGYDVNNGAAPAAGVYFETDADGDIIPTTRASSTSTALTGAGKIGAAGTYTDLTWIVNSASTRVDFWVAKAHAGSSTTNIPKTTALFVGVQFDRSAGRTDRSVGVDRFIFHSARG